MKSDQIFGLDIFRGDIEAAVTRAIELASNAKSSLIVTPNIDHLMRLEHDLNFRLAYQSASLQILDSQPLKIMANLFLRGRRQDLHRITGVDFTFALSKRLQETGYSMCIVGGDNATARAATRRLREMYPALKIKKPVVPPYAPITDISAWVKAAIECKSRGATFYLVCLGSPKQELIARNILMPSVPGVFVCVGAAVDFAANKYSRAPLAVQKAGFEWAWRLAGEPRRLWLRYARNLAFLMRLAVKHALARQ